MFSAARVRDLAGALATGDAETLLRLHHPDFRWLTAAGDQLDRQKLPRDVHRGRSPVAEPTARGILDLVRRSTGWSPLATRRRSLLGAGGGTANGAAVSGVPRLVVEPQQESAPRLSQKVRRCRSQFHGGDSVELDRGQLGVQRIDIGQVHFSADVYREGGRRRGDNEVKQWHVLAGSGRVHGSPVLEALRRAAPQPFSTAAGDTLTTLRELTSAHCTLAPMRGYVSDSHVLPGTATCAPSGRTGVPDGRRRHVPLRDVAPALVYQRQRS